MYLTGPSRVAQWVKNLPAMQKTKIQSVGREDPLEKEISTHSRILAWEEGLEGCCPWSHKSQIQLSN